MLPALGHTSFNLGQTYVMTAGKRHRRVRRADRWRDQRPRASVQADRRVHNDSGTGEVTVCPRQSLRRQHGNRANLRDALAALTMHTGGKSAGGTTWRTGRRPDRLPPAKKSFWIAPARLRFLLRSPAASTRKWSLAGCWKPLKGRLRDPAPSGARARGRGPSRCVCQR